MIYYEVKLKPKVNHNLQLTFYASTLEYTWLIFCKQGQKLSITT